MSRITQKKKELKKANTPAPLVTHIVVDDDVYTNITNQADPDDDWSADSTSKYHYINGIQTHPRYGDIDCSFEVHPLTDYYLLYYLYGSGDSFSSHTGRIEFIALYNDKILAEKSYKALNIAGSKGESKVTIWNDLGQKYEEYIIQDYFGGFEGSNLITVQLF